jgi:hypothetical protein
VRSAISRFGLRLSVIVTTENHIDPDLEKRARGNQYFQNTIELAGALGVPYVGTASGTMPGKNLNEQVQEIVRVYNEKYFRYARSTRSGFCGNRGPAVPTTLPDFVDKIYDVHLKDTEILWHQSAQLGPRRADAVQKSRRAPALTLGL